MKSLLHKQVRSCSQAINDHSQDDTSSLLVSFSLFLKFFFACLLGGRHRIWAQNRANMAVLRLGWPWLMSR